MSWRPRLVALDIDGTITRVGAEEIAPAVRAAIHRAVDHGAHVVLSTGRSLIGTRPIVDDLELRGTTAICSNGAVWWDTTSREVIRKIAFDAAPTVDALRGLFPGAVFAVEITGVGNLSLGRFPEGDLWGVVREVTAEELTAETTSRLVMRWADRTPDEIALRMLDVELPGVTWWVDNTEPWLTVSPEGVTKGSALEDLRQRLGVSEEDTLAIGDGHNDVEMLRWAAHGVAMGQAPATVQEVANAVTATVLEDGAALELDRWFAA
ncbi:hydroxymethylpyrimidine pyrophosphatase-like HAD family hydrolase [Saccharothrix tamanrassetensis]|uniref:Hydroxymethylpyrimidine pyrophosphatase-like HAD family hydrolase n=1 Tax=Saccharothrix tamanrassetensis TaxID=1051531 RepID=A0A841CTF3_9PSEU|nr:HAD-IIB family hydrolase [Saccharothrix tamanrassetensis]MBB5960579.1 hydroxymethylpyrimidine pyrophosphatase-like HAD family hydrolase [Saccharothrix tamanrassetensis]